MMLDLPQPFGPTTPVRFPGKCSVVGSTKDLKPASLIVDRRMSTARGGCVGMKREGIGRTLGNAPECRGDYSSADSSSRRRRPFELQR